MDALAVKVRRSPLRVREEDLTQVIGQPPVCLFRHRLVEASKARLDVRDRDMELRCGQGGRKRGVDVAGDDNERRKVLKQDLLDPDERLRRLLSVRPGADTKEDVGLSAAPVRR